VSLSLLTTGVQRPAPTGELSAGQYGMAPKGALHGYSHGRLRKLLDFAKKHADQRNAGLEELETLYLNYADPDKVADDGRQQYPHERTIVVPFTWAAIQVKASHIHSSWMSRQPWMSLRAVNPAHDRQAEALEAVLDAGHLEDFTGLKLWGAGIDSLCFGQGRVHTDWETQTEETEQDGMMALLGLAPQRRLVREGQVNVVIPPRDWLPDPRVPGWDPQQGEFVAFKTRRARSWLLGKQEEGIYFNVEAIPPSSGTAEPTGRARVPGQFDIVSGDPLSGDLDFVELEVVFVRLIPSRWKPEGGAPLGPSRSPQVWRFVIANGDIIIRAESLENAHGKFPVAVCDAQLDVHTLYGQSDIEVVKGLQYHCDFLYNSRQANIRLGLLMAFLFDPRYIEEDDVFAAQPAIRMRLKEAAGGLPDLRRAFMQIPVSDVTATYRQDIEMQVETIKQILGASDTMQGVNTPGNMTATEARPMFQMAQALIGGQANRMWQQMVLPLGRMEISDAQQFMSEERYYRLSGEADRRWQAAGMQVQAGRAKVGPNEIQGDVDVTVTDVAQPVDRAAEGALLLQFAAQVAKAPELASRFDLVEIVKEGMRHSGASNIDDYVLANPIQTQIVPDEQALAGAEAGNLVPTGAGGPGPADLAAMLAGGGTP